MLLFVSTGQRAIAEVVIYKSIPGRAERVNRELPTVAVSFLGQKGSESEMEKSEKLPGKICGMKKKTFRPLETRVRRKKKKEKKTP